VPTSCSSKKLLILTGGDPRGTGPEVILKSLAGSACAGAGAFLIIGDWAVFQEAAKRLKISTSSIKNNFLDLKNVPFRPLHGKKAHSACGNKICGKASIDYISRAARIAKSVRGSSVVTAPISKLAINKAGYAFGGHTEFLARVTKSKRVTMMLVGGSLRVSLVTRHVPLGEAAKRITGNKITETAENTHYALKRFFRIRYPKIGVAGINPHAGEGGLLGREESAIIGPCVKRLQKKLKGITGPLPADTLFYKAYRGELDAVVAMYHDQALIPLKMVAFEKSVNLTIGLPFVRTSPGHGTAFDIAGKGKANPSSMIEAIKLAARLT